MKEKGEEINQINKKKTLYKIKKFCEERNIVIRFFDDYS